MRKTETQNAVGAESALYAIFTQQEGNINRQEARYLLEQFRVLMTYYRCAIKEIETKFQVLNEEFSLRYDRNPINNIHSRLKKGTSIYEKMQKKDLPITLENMESQLNDIAGIRVVCTFQDDVYYLERALLEQDDIQLLERKDYIRFPKENGYRSLHLIVAVPIFLSRGKRIMKVEVQLRTIAMDSWASLEHQLRYKKSHSLNETSEDILRYCAQLSSELDSKMNDLCQCLDTQDYPFIS